VSVQSVVITAAGLGTRLWPATKAIQKEMLIVGDRPGLQHVVEECLSAGMMQLIFVIGRNGEQIRRHFGAGARAAGDVLPDGLAASDARFSYLRQMEPRGLGHAIACAAPLLEGQPFAVALGDSVFAPARTAACCVD
jgi:UTP--glucose-1-phosphate uridylyltransferase